tara:strand:- start:594 stop:890 length:297 start_codon:yes stop_codon:yes gene_type:complete
MSAITEIDEGDMYAWVANELYEELLKMPLWVTCAFERNGEFVFEEVQQRLATYLILKQMDRCPPYSYNRDFRHNWKMSEFVSLFKQAWSQASLFPSRG